jgi:hypothetical protein
MKLMGYFLAFVLLMYSIVSFIYVDPSSGKTKATIENSVKGLIYLGLTLILAYVVSTN